MMAGRPTVMTKDVIAKLEHAFSCDCNKQEACLYAGISHDSLDRYINKNPQFSVRIEQLRQKPRMTAKLNISSDLGDGDVSTSKWLLERRDDDYNPKQKQEHSVDKDTKTLLEQIIDRNKDSKE
jgi:hypothetical protein